MPSIDINWEFKKVTKNTSAIRRGVLDGMEAAAEDLMDEGENTAKNRVYTSRRVWHGEVYEGFETGVQRLSPTKVRGRLSNYVQHAAVVDEGRKPGETAPQVQHIIEWVDDHLTTSGVKKYSSGGGGGVGSSVGTYTRDPNHAMYDESIAVENVKSLGSEGIQSGTANDGQTSIIEYANGDKGIFKQYDDGSYFNPVGIERPGSIQNEQIYDGWVKLLGWDDQRGFPGSAHQELPNGDHGNVQEKIPNAEEAMDAMRSLFDDGLEYDDLLRDHKEFLAKAGLLDYLLFNNDRHERNWMVTPDGQPWAIDSGGHMAPNVEYRGYRMFMFFADDAIDLDSKRPDGSWFIENADDAYHDLHDLMDMQEEIFEKLEQDTQLRESLVDFADGLARDDNLWKDHFFEHISKDSLDDEHHLFRPSSKLGTGSKPIWKYHLDKNRELIDEKYQRRLNEESGGTSVPTYDSVTDYYTSTSPIITGDISALLNDLLRRYNETT